MIQSITMTEDNYGLYDDNKSFNGYSENMTKPETYKNEREKQFMSYVIMCANNNGIACATDSRSTLNGNTWYPEIENDNTQKLFKTNKMLIATFGLNKTFNGVDYSKRLEEEINETIKDKTIETPFDFCMKLLNKIKIIQSPNTYSFLIGFKNEICEYVLNQNGIQVFFKGKAIVTINNGALPNYNLFAFNINEDIKKVAVKCKETCEEVISLVQNKCVFQFVGGPVQVDYIESKNIENIDN